MFGPLPAIGQYNAYGQRPWSPYLSVAPQVQLTRGVRSVGPPTGDTYTPDGNPDPDPGADPGAAGASALDITGTGSAGGGLGLSGGFAGGTGDLPATAPDAAAPAATKAPFPFLASKSPSSDVMYKNLLADTADTRISSPWQLLGGLAEFGVGNELEKKYNAGQSAGIDDLAKALAADPNADVINLMIASTNPTIRTQGIALKAAQAKKGEWIDLPPDAAGNVYQRSTVTGELRKGIDSGLMTPAQVAQREQIQSGGRPPALETEESKTLGAARTKAFTKYTEDAANSADVLQTLSTMAGLAEDPNFYSGPGGEDWVLPFKQAVGVITGDPNAAASMEAFNASSKQLALQKIGGSLGSGFSNADRSFITLQTPSIASTPGGNRLLMQIAERVARRKIEIGQRAEAYRKEHGTFDQAGFAAELRDWAQTNGALDGLAGLSAKKPGATGAPAAPATPPAPGTPDDPLGVFAP